MDASIDALLGAIAARIQTTTPQNKGPTAFQPDPMENISFYKMPSPGQEGTAIFKGNTTVEFLEKFEDQGGDFQTPAKDAIGEPPWVQAEDFLSKEHGRQDADRFLDEEEQIERVTKGPPISSSDLNSAQALFTKIDNVITRAKRRDLHVVTDKSLIKAVRKRFHADIVKEATEEVGVTLDGFVRSMKYAKSKAGLLDAIAHKKEYSPLFANEQSQPDPVPGPPAASPAGYGADGTSKLKIYQNSVHSRGPARVFEVSAARPDRPTMMGPKDRCWYCWNQQHRFIRDRDQSTFDKDAHLVILIQGAWYYGRRDGHDPMDDITLAVVENGRKRGIADRVTLLSHVANMSTEEGTKLLAKQVLDHQIGLPWQTTPTLPSADPTRAVRCVHVVRPGPACHSQADVYAVRRGRPPKNRTSATEPHFKKTYGIESPSQTSQCKKRTVSFSDRGREIMAIDDDDDNDDEVFEARESMNSEPISRPKTAEVPISAPDASAQEGQEPLSREAQKTMTADQPRDFDLRVEAGKLAEKRLEAPISLPVNLLPRFMPEYTAAMATLMRDQGYSDPDGILLEAPKSLVDLADNGQQRKDVEDLLNEYDENLLSRSSRAAKIGRVRSADPTSKMSNFRDFECPPAVGSPNVQR
ncbi:hypothetical protein CMEL01_16791 [Colletotrichum melonis]|uniref:Uncharacterized protein n=1 Tax=Colletotrichum melonis TaxID=1209925 RepID=A0AAI9U3B8_9PEZI|nr:hypothetical protein CMEL01_16791 [Colletotrichum melonis]